LNNLTFHLFKTADVSVRQVHCGRSISHWRWLIRGGEVYLLHVIDADFLAQVSDESFCDAETARTEMQQKAERQLQKIALERSLLNVRLESMVVVGKPFAEILRIAADLNFSLIMMGIRGKHRGGIEEILFGSTAEKVLRAACVPVMCVPTGLEAKTNG
jgi:nucleotide-binding universal stress UspA family protein